MTAISIERNTELFKALPKDYQEAIRTSDYDNALGSITKEHKLHIDQSATLEYLLAKLIFGGISSKDIISEMESRLSVSNETAITIAKELDQMIIRPIKENLQEIQASNSTNTQTKEDED